MVRQKIMTCVKGAMRFFFPWMLKKTPPHFGGTPFSPLSTTNSIDSTSQLPPAVASVEKMRRGQGTIHVIMFIYLYANICIFF